MNLIDNDKLRIRLLQESDSSLLLKWMQDPSILQYYEGRDHSFTEELIKEKFFSDPSYVTKCMIEYENNVIGYIQFYPIEQEERVGYGYNDELTIYGTDQFIGESYYWNKGIGTLLVSNIIDYLTSNFHPDFIVMDPQAWNIRAIACYEKCGFQKRRLLLKHEWHEGQYRDCWLMEYSCDKEKVINDL